MIIEETAYSDIKVENFLSHHGVKGMRWGVINKPAVRVGIKAGQFIDRRKRQHNLNKASRARDKAKAAEDFVKLRELLRPKPGLSRQSDIDRARARFATGAAKADFKEAKIKYKQDKVIIGRREARKTLKKHKKAYNKDFARSQQIRDGYEFTKVVLNSVAESLETEKNREARLNTTPRDLNMKNTLRK